MPASTRPPRLLRRLPPLPKRPPLLLRRPPPRRPASVAGTGRDGRVTKGDALAAGNAPAAKAAAPVAPPTLSLDGRPEQRVPMSRLRARIAERLLQSQAENAILTTFNEVNMQAVMDLRARYKDKFEKEHGVKLGFMSFFVKAAVAALKKYPVLNASVDGKDIIYHGYFDIGIAVGTPRGLVVPILRNADQLTIAEIEKTIADFGKRAADGKLGIEEMTGGTFSISNGGVFGSMLSTPIINPPQAAIVLDLQRRGVRLDAVHAHHQPAAGGHPGHPRHQGAPGGRERPDRHPADQLPGHVL
ncbi:2-oxoacid dehydrogenase acyltransferase, catalytic domain protein [Bordetella pertussis STO1-CHOC-0018]|nr:2-oxoacid dehydrogenase acyltransferase, catalytic domain protein [Bordetella pertussis STO1-CHOC-0018]